MTQIVVNGRRHLTSYSVWRAAVLVAIVLSASALVLAPFLFNEVKTAARANHDLTCSIGNLVTVVRDGESQVVGLGRAAAQLDYLTRIRDADCEYIESHPRIAGAIDEAINSLTERIGEP